MGFYSDTSLALLCQQILRDNPGLPYPLTKDNVLILSGPLTSGLGTSGRNSRITLNGKLGSGFSGRKEFFYDRLKMESIYTSLLSTLVLTMPNGVATNADLLPTINDALGLGLASTDLAAPSTTLGLGRTPTTATLALATNCPCFTGTLTVQWQRGSTAIYPDSGPGSKVMLMGDLNEGYFGMVTQQELAKGVDVYAAFAEGKSLGTAGGVDTADMFWLKFALDGKICYFPSRNIGANITWNTLANNGAARGDAKYPITFEAGDGSTVFAQLRLPNISTTEVVNPSRGDPTSDPVRLFNKVHKQTYGTGVWDELTTINMAEVFWWLNRYAASSGNSAVISQFNIASVNANAIVNTHNWRPMLVLVDGELVLVPLRNVQGERYSVLSAPGLTYDRTPDPKQLTRVRDVNGTLDNPVRKPWLNPVGSAPLTAVHNLAIVRGLKPIHPQVSVTINTKINLATANGELTGF
ncbi:virion structural protein [Erwinia phage phiEaH2]|uniref:Putative virion structural protein n=1 Tax=Erwinia phage phiEaH2 TaxID=1029988 RepID=J7KDY9_9CAUD|nr:virion structural protein [Erwinia phage phiEaH2]AFQ96614.1 putative virion structural protein [Erwinia phage phiEaH2]